MKINHLTALMIIVGSCVQNISAATIFIHNKTDNDIKVTPALSNQTAQKFLNAGIIGTELLVEVPVIFAGAVGSMGLLVPPFIDVAPGVRVSLHQGESFTVKPDKYSEKHLLPHENRKYYDSGVYNLVALLWQDKNGATWSAYLDMSSVTTLQNIKIYDNGRYVFSNAIDLNKKEGQAQKVK